MSKKLASWNKAFLSRGGRLTLISAVLNSLPMHFMSLFRIPKGVTDLLEKIMRDFFGMVTTEIHIVIGLLGRKYVYRMKKEVWVLRIFV